MAQYDDQPLRYPCLVAKTSLYAYSIIIFALNHISAQDTMIGTMRTTRSPTATCEHLQFIVRSIESLKYLLQSKLMIYQLQYYLNHLPLSISISKNNENTMTPVFTLDSNIIKYCWKLFGSACLSWRGLHSQLFTKLKQLVETMHGILVLRNAFFCAQRQFTSMIADLSCINKSIYIKSHIYIYYTYI